VTISDAAPPISRAIEFEVRKVIQETSDSLSLILAGPAAEQPALSYQPGQFLTLRIPCEDGEAVARCYSFASSPHGNEMPKVTVKRTSNGYASNWLWDNAHAGLRVAALPPAGTFVPASFDADLLLIAGGSGITPIISILKSAILRGQGRIVLIYSNRDASTVIFAAELHQLAAAHPHRLTTIHWLSRNQGRMTEERLQALTAPYRSYTAFICGPVGLMDAARDALRAIEMPADRINVEVFKSLSTNPFAVVPRNVGVEHERAAVRVEIDLQGKTHRLLWPADVTLLDLMLRHGLDAPYLCCEGVCGTCTCLLERGKVRMMSSEAVNPGDIDVGYVLACQSLHTGVDAKISF
jgi:3-ketosteroid 9alpha-monooxygenase subunit B